MRDDPRVVALVTRASGGDQDAWHELVERYASLVYTICTRYRLSNHDIEDVGQSVWLLLVEQLGKLREPAALPGWLATTTARECLRVLTDWHRLIAVLHVLGNGGQHRRNRTPRQYDSAGAPGEGHD